ncbi:hypothetical protein [Fusicatenibacter sp.]
MKIGVTGSEHICNAIQKTLEKRMPDLEVIYECSSNYQYGLEAAAKFQEMKLAGILFTGPTNYQYALKRLEPTIPWTFLPHTQTSILKALLASFVRYSCTPDVVSIDMYEAELIQETMAEAGILHGRVLIAHGSSPDQDDFQDSITKFHRYNYYHEGAKICFTNLEKTYESLTAEGIPCVRISVSEDIILDQIYHLQFLENAAQQNRGQNASVQIYFDYSFDQETDLSLREWEKIHYQNEMREMIYSIAHRMGAAAFSDGASTFYIMSSRQALMREFIQNGEYQKLLFQGQQTPHNRLWIGIGYGASPMEAKSRAAMALNHSIADHSGANYIAEEEDILTEIKPEHPVDHTEYLLHQLHLSNHTYTKLKEILDSHNHQITSAQLAAEMEITERSANRLILRLEQENCVTTIGKIGGGRGRPARVLKIIL